MSRTTLAILRRSLAASALAAACAFAPDASAQYAPAPSQPPPQYVAPPVAVAPPPPPTAYIAVTPPEYYDGRAVYWYNGYWFYRDHRGAWSYYRHEPTTLRDHRAHWAARPRYHYRH